MAVRPVRRDTALSGPTRGRLASYPCQAARRPLRARMAPDGGVV